MIESAFSWSLLSLVGLGIFHGINPGMGWLFAVAIGMQNRKLRAVVVSLGPIALGHALAIAIVVFSVWFLGAFIPSEILMISGGLLLLSFASYKLATRFRHPRWVGMRPGKLELTLWSFLMATAHGAGLMLIPITLRLRGGEVTHATAAGPHQHHIATDSEPLWMAITTVGIHTLAMIITSLVLAMIVYSLADVGVLRKAWINLDWIWAGALVIAGVTTLIMGLIQVISV